MKHLLNTLFITSEDIYLSAGWRKCGGQQEKQAVARYPLHTLFGIVSFSYGGCFACLDGRLCGAWGKSVFLLAQGAFPGAGVWGKQRECAAAQNAVSGGG